MAQYSDRGRSSGYNPGPRCCGGEDRNRALIGAGGKLEVEGSREECSEITGVECESGATLIPLWCQAFICSLVPVLSSTGVLFHSPKIPFRSRPGFFPSSHPNTALSAFSFFLGFQLPAAPSSQFSSIFSIYLCLPPAQEEKSQSSPGGYMSWKPGGKEMGGVDWELVKWSVVS